MVTEPVALTIGDFSFHAVPLEHARFDEKEAIHVVLVLEPDGEFSVVDIGQSDAAGVSSINTGARRNAWLNRAMMRNLWVGVYLVPVEMLFGGAKNPHEHRAHLVQKLRHAYSLPRE